MDAAIATPGWPTALVRTSYTAAYTAGAPGWSTHNSAPAARSVAESVGSDTANWLTCTGSWHWWNRAVVDAAGAVDAGAAGARDADVGQVGRLAAQWPVQALMVA